MSRSPERTSRLPELWALRILYFGAAVVFVLFVRVELTTFLARP